MTVEEDAYDLIMRTRVARGLPFHFGDPLPGRHDGPQVKVRLPPADLEQIRAAAAEKGLTVAEWCRGWIERALDLQEAGLFPPGPPPPDRPAPQPALAVLKMRRIQQKQVAADYGCSRTYVNHILQSRVPASPAFRRWLSEYLDLPEDRLFR